MKAAPPSTTFQQGHQALAQLVEAWRQSDDRQRHELVELAVDVVAELAASQRRLEERLP